MEWHWGLREFSKFFSPLLPYIEPLFFPILVHVWLLNVGDILLFEHLFPKHVSVEDT